MDIGVLTGALAMTLNIMRLLIFARIILSWFRVDKDNMLYKLLLDVTEPILSPIRKALSKSPIGGQDMPIDFSPLITILALHFISQILTAI